MEGKPAQPEILITYTKTGALIEASLKAGIVLENTDAGTGSTGGVCRKLVWHFRLLMTY